MTELPYTACVCGGGGEGHVTSQVMTELPYTACVCVCVCVCVGGGGSCNITSNDCIISYNMLSRPPGLGDWTDGELCLKLLFF